MKVISQQAELSTMYTNHSLKTKTITILDRSGFEARGIMSVRGHRNEGSIKSYMASCLMAVIDNNKNRFVAFEEGENDRNEELGLLTNS